MHKLTIYQCQIPDSPREWDNFGVIAYKSRQYILGDEQITGDPIDWLCEMLDYEDLMDYNEQNEKDLDYNNETLSYLGSEFMEKYIALPVYKYEHGGVTISTSPFSCPWDSGQIGYIYIPEDRMEEIEHFPEDWLKGRTKEQAAKDMLQGEINEFDQYICGDVYGFRVEDENENLIDSCGGFYGDDFENNGMLDHLPEDMENQLKDYDFSQIEY